jgi:hypothetical protein
LASSLMLCFFTCAGFTGAAIGRQIRLQKYKFYL